MPTINEISAAACRLLKADGELSGMAAIYRGGKRPSRAKNPSVTVEARRLERGEGEGVWMCDVVATAYADELTDGAPDYDRLEALGARIRELLADVELEIPGTKPLPLIEGGTSGTEWDSAHGGESSEEHVFGLVFVSFGAVAA